MTDDLRLPPAPVRSVYLDSGEEVADFAPSDFGNQPDWTKDDLIDKLIVIRGLSDDTWQEEGSNFPPARSVLYTTEIDETADEPWGMFFSDNSPIIDQIRKQFRKNGGRPFAATLVKVTSGSHQGQSYWILKPWTKNVSPKGVASTGNQKG